MGSMLRQKERRRPSPMETRHRPRYHFLPPANWMNDPNGLIQWQGQYHLFYQHNPEAAYWGNMHWGHAVSDDLVRWTHLPIALAPTPGGADKDGCFSGCAVDWDGVPTLVYTGVQPEVQCLAVSHDGLLTWQKHPRSPVIGGPPEGLDVTGFRDPYVWREADGLWRLALGSGIRGQGGAVLLYRSSNLLDWDYLPPLCVGDIARNGYNWECPNFFPLGDRHVLIVSPELLGKAIYMAGDYGGLSFTPRVEGDVDGGGSLYAPQVMRNAQGRRLLWGWLREGRSREAQIAAGWSGAMSLPRELALLPDGRLGSRPAPELRALRQEHIRLASLDIGSDIVPLPGVQGDALEIVLRLNLGEAEGIDLLVRRSPDSQEQTCFRYDRATGHLECDRAQASLSPDQDRTLHGAAHPLEGDALRLHLFLDASVIELYADEATCLTTRVYPQREDSLGVALAARGGAARLLSADAWRLAAIA